MIKSREISVGPGDQLLILGTTKGSFLFRRNEGGAGWEMGGPHFAGTSVYSCAYDSRKGRHRILVGASSMHWGTLLCSSDDFGSTWKIPQEATIRFPSTSNESLKQIWQIAPGPPGEPDTLYCGVEPAALFVSRDAGESWSLVEGLYNHPHRPQWQPGGGGLGLHTILVDPVNSGRMYVAISTGGVYRSDDRGETWRASNNGIRAVFLPDQYPDFGQCVHKVVMHPGRPDTLFLQNHWGLYRSDDGAASWQDIARGVPSDFGFPIVVTATEPESVYVIPLDSDEFRCASELKLRVYRLRDGERAWEPLTQGLPQENAFDLVLRDAFEADKFSPSNLFFGTRTGRLYGSYDAGESWNVIADDLPPITCVRAARVDGTVDTIH